MFCDTFLSVTKIVITVDQQDIRTRRPTSTFKIHEKTDARGVSFTKTHTKSQADSPERRPQVGCSPSQTHNEFDKASPCYTSRSANNNSCLGRLRLQHHSYTHLDYFSFASPTVTRFEASFLAVLDHKTIKLTETCIAIPPTKLHFSFNQSVQT